MRTVPCTNRVGAAGVAGAVGETLSAGTEALAAGFAAAAVRGAAGGLAWQAPRARASAKSEVDSLVMGAILLVDYLR
ncbi:hypothetical protein D3C72_2413030 [compost metagenome]